MVMHEFQTGMTGPCTRYGEYLFCDGTMFVHSVRISQRLGTLSEEIAQSTVLIFRHIDPTINSMTWPQITQLTRRGASIREVH